MKHKIPKVFWAFLLGCVFGISLVLMLYFDTEFEYGKMMVCFIFEMFSFLISLDLMMLEVEDDKQKRSDEDG